jgi:hypothetical protein
VIEISRVATREVSETINPVASTDEVLMQFSSISSSADIKSFNTLSHDLDQVAVIQLLNDFC